MKQQGEKIEIQSVMTLCPHSVGAEQPITVARDLLRKFGFRHLPVQERGKIVAVLSERDVEFASSWQGEAFERLKVSDVATMDPFVVAPEAPLAEVLERMEQDRLGCTLVANKDKVVGIFTTTDVCRVLRERI